ncbi:hypothetical protein JCM8097_001472 [Rhodosporidiobolus ruineniae]
MRTSTVSALLTALIAAPAALADLASFRATIPGSLHQCENTNVFIFDSSNARPVTLVFVPAAVAPSGTTTLSAALALGPYQVVEGITTPDAAQYNFQLQIAQGESFATLGFLPDGTGKNLNLPRTVMASLPGADQCNPATAATAAAAAGSSGSTGSSAANNAAAGSTLSTSVLAAGAASSASSAAAAASTLATSVSSSASSAASSVSSSASSAAEGASQSATAAGGNSGAATFGAAGSLVAVAAAAIVGLAAL